MVELHVLVPEEHVHAVYRFLGELLAPNEPIIEPPAAGIAWTKELALEALGSLNSEAEYRLLRRLAEARSQRVPLSELASAFGLPSDACGERDFAELSAWCAEASRPAMPVVTGGTGADGWYWMAVAAYDRFLAAFDEDDPAS
jgi:hypothetical protein